MWRMDILYAISGILFRESQYFSVDAYSDIIG